MAGSFNRITIVGNLGRDPEVRALPSGDSVADFSVATTERGRNGKEDTTTWFRVSVFGKAADTAGQYLHKGSYVYVDGRLSQREYTGNDGTARTSIEVNANDFRMLDKAPSSDGGGHESTPSRPNGATRKPAATAAGSGYDTDL